MAKPTERLPLLDLADMPSDARPAYEAVARSRGGRMLNLFRALAHAPQGMEAVAGVGAWLRYGGTLPADLRELAILTVARETGSAYEWAQHWPIAAKTGLAGNILDGVRTRALEDGTTRQGRALTYVRLACHNDAVADSLIEDLRADFGNEGLVELTMIAGYYGMLARFLRLMQVPPDA